MVPGVGRTAGGLLARNGAPGITTERQSPDRPIRTIRPCLARGADQGCGTSVRTLIRAPGWALIVAIEGQYERGLHDASGTGAAE